MVASHSPSRLKPLSKVGVYFDEIADNYPCMTSSGILGLMKRREKDSILRMLSPAKNDSVLDAGCGSGFYSILIKGLGASVTGVDISKRMVEIARAKGIDAEIGDLESLNLDNKFDKILCAGVLEFCEDRLAVVRNLCSFLKKDGCIVFLMPKRCLLGILYRLYHLSHGIKVGIFSIDDVRNLLERAGLRITEVEEPTKISLVIKCIKGS